MNVIKAIFIEYKAIKELCLVKLKLDDGLFFNALVLDVRELFEENSHKEVELLIKENDIILTSKASNLAIENSFNVEFESIEKGKILSQIFFKDLPFTKNLSALVSNEGLENFTLDEGLKIYISPSNIILRFV